MGLGVWPLGGGRERDGHLEIKRTGDTQQSEELYCYKYKYKYKKKYKNNNKYKYLEIKEASDTQ